MPGAPIAERDGLTSMTNTMTGTITVDKSDANLAALEALNAERATPIKVRSTGEVTSEILGEK